VPQTNAVDNFVWTPYIQSMNWSDELLEGLRSRRDKLRADIADLQRKIVEDTEALKQRQMTLESVIELLRREGVTESAELDARHFLEVAHDHLLENGAMHYTKLCAELLARGVFIPGAKPDANLLAHINRDPRFHRVGRGEYSISTRRGRKTNGGNSK
jgi:hypothetical protein